MKACPACGGDDIESSDGTQVCAACGFVLGESEIVNDVTFGETAAGAATVHGTQVSGATGKHAMVGPGGRRYGDGTDSREATIFQAKQNIRNICRRLHQDSEELHQTATRIFTLALNIGQGKTWFSHPETHERDAGGNLIQGRRSSYSYGACVYLAFRRKKIPIMMIEVADAVNCNVFVLGRAYLRLAQMLRFDPEQSSIEVMEPSMYIRRFARLLDFGDEYERVVEDASRLCTRFKNDWLVQGRRPSGITGACLLLAARMNNFRRSVAEIVQVVKVADVTLKRRLDEFKETPAAKLTINDFRELYNNVSEGALPPSSAKSQAEARKRRDEKKNIARKISARGSKIKAGSPEAKAKRVDKGKGRATDEDDEEEDAADDEMDSDHEDASSRIDMEPELEEKVDKALTDEVQELLDSPRLRDDLDRVTREQEEREERARLTAAERLASLKHAPGPSRAAAAPDDNARASSSRPKKRSRTEEPVAKEQRLYAKEDPNDPLMGLDEAELDEYLLTPAEQEVKERVWTEFNKDWLAESMQRMIKEEEDRKRGIVPKRHKPRKKAVLRDSSNAAGASAVESTAEMLKRKKLSKKINYNALNHLFPGQQSVVGISGPASYSNVDDEADIGAAYNVYGRAASQARSEASTGLGGDSDYVSEDGESVRRGKSGSSSRRRERNKSASAAADSDTGRRSDRSRSRDAGSDAGGFTSDGGAGSDAYADGYDAYDDGYADD